MKRKAPDEATGVVREIIELAPDEYGRYMLAGYREEKLRTALMMLQDYNLYEATQDAIYKELLLREENRNWQGKKDGALLRWFEPRWNSVISLFGKGPYVVAEHKETVKENLLLV